VLPYYFSSDQTNERLAAFSLGRRYFADQLLKRVSDREGKSGDGSFDQEGVDEYKKLLKKAEDVEKDLLARFDASDGSAGPTGGLRDLLKDLSKTTQEIRMLKGLISRENLRKDDFIRAATLAPFVRRQASYWDLKGQ
jgi:hypothetical protein